MSLKDAEELANKFGSDLTVRQEWALDFALSLLDHTDNYGDEDFEEKRIIEKAVRLSDLLLIELTKDI